MKQLLFLVALFLVFHSNAQKWLWVKNSVNSSNNSDCAPLAIAADVSGNVFQVGTYYDSVFFNPDTLTNITGKSRNGFLVKYNSYGKVLWAKSPVVYGTSKCVPRAVATDRKGNAFITGFYTDTVMFGATTLTVPLYGSAFIAKYDANGNVLWVRTAGAGSQFNDSYGIATDDSGNVVITGYYEENVSFGPYYLNNGGGVCFVVKYDSSGNVKWAWSVAVPRMLNNQSEGNAVTVDTSGNIYVTGGFDDTAYFDSYTMVTPAYSNVFLAKFNSVGKVLWVTGPTGNNVPEDYDNWGTSITIDRSGKIYVVGDFWDTLSFGAYQLNNGGFSNAFIAKYDGNGNVLWAKSPKTVQSSPFMVRAWSIVSSGPNLYLAGSFGDTLVFDSIMLVYNTTEYPEEYLIKLDTAGNARCGTRFGNMTDDYGGNVLAPDPINNDVFCTGYFGNDTCLFDSSKITGVGYYIGYLGKWACVSCNFIPIITGKHDLCKGDSIPISASGGSSYVWSPTKGLSGNNIPDPMASPSANTTYTVVVSNGGCYTKDSIHITVLPLPVVSVCCDSVILKGQNAQLIAGGGSEYKWTPAYGLNCDTCSVLIATPDQTTTYTVNITSDSGCSTIKTVTIEVNCGNVFVPDAFSPNGDGQNDILYVRGDCIKEIDFRIFDRWGNKVFESASLSNGWDGTYSGKLMNTGTYVYFLVVSTYDGKAYSKKGNVALVR